MMQGHYYTQMYNIFCDAQYTFDEYPKIENKESQDSNQIIDLEANS